MSVGTLLGSPAARGLFQRAIPQSGAAHNAHDRETSARVADFFLRALGSADPRALRDAPVERILAAQLQCTLRVGELGVLLAFQPTAGTAGVARAAARGRARGQRGRRAGARRHHARRVAAVRVPRPGSARDGRRGLPRARGRSASAARRRRRSPTSTARTRPTRRPPITSPRSRPIACSACPRCASRTPRPHTRRCMATSSRGRRPRGDGALGACHAVELPFVFGTLDAPGMAAFSGSGPDAERLSGVVMDTWAAFARSGDPANAAIPRWPRHDPATRPTLILDRDPRVELAPRDRTLRAWEGIRGRPASPSNRSIRNDRAREDRLGRPDRRRPRGARFRARERDPDRWLGAQGPPRRRRPDSRSLSGSRRDRVRRPRRSYRAERPRFRRHADPVSRAARRRLAADLPGGDTRGQARAPPRSRSARSRRGGGASAQLARGAASAHPQRGGPAREQGPADRRRDGRRSRGGAPRVPDRFSPEPRSAGRRPPRWTSWRSKR